MKGQKYNSALLGAILIILAIPMALLGKDGGSPDSKLLANNRVEGSSLNSETRFVQKGIWGGEHLSLLVEDNRARLEYDCARGTIDQPMRVDTKGRFNVTGTHTRESGGPTSEGERPDSHPARYTGQVTGKKMVITITLTDTKESVGTFTLAQGQKPDLFKCK
jgi:hypothetical protein